MKRKILDIISILAIYFGVYVNIVDIITNITNITIPNFILDILRTWATALIPLIVMVINKDKLSDYKCTKLELGKQVLIGILIGIFLTIVLLLPEYIIGTNTDAATELKNVWEYIYIFVYYIFAVALMEEFVCRGVLYQRCLSLFKRENVAIIISSVLFGSQHFHNQGISGVIFATLFGIFACICRKKIKNCTLLSIIIFHGIFDAMNDVLASLLL